MTRLTPQVEHVQQYYETNTSAFARFGQGTGTGTIRRAVWGPEVQSSQAAFEYVDQLILGQVEQAARASGQPITVLDLGCGLGGSLCFLAQRLPIKGVGHDQRSASCRCARACREPARSRSLAVSARGLHAAAGHPARAVGVFDRGVCAFAFARSVFPGCSAPARARWQLDHLR
jgi:cyclopropane fatty-acyl-phospholipid synthase-like methyltransferase